MPEADGEEAEVRALMESISAGSSSSLLEVGAALVAHLIFYHRRRMGPATVDSLLLLEPLVRGEISAWQVEWMLAYPQAFPRFSRPRSTASS